MGDSIGRWEGDTLVVDTTNFNADQIRYVVQAAPGADCSMVESIGAKPQDRLQGPSKDLHVIERFTRVAENALLYRFTIEDPGTWVAPWTGEFTWPATNEQIYEYACHEANYATGEHPARRAAARRGGEVVNVERTFLRCDGDSR